RDRLPIPGAGGSVQLHGQLVSDRPVVGGGKGCAAALRVGRTEIADLVDQCGLHPAEGEVQPSLTHCLREVERLRISIPRRSLDRGATGISQAEQPGALVEGLAGGIVDGLAENLEAGWLANPGQQRVAPARDQAEKGWLDRIRLEVVRGDVSLQVVDRDQWLSMG